MIIGSSPFQRQPISGFTTNVPKKQKALVCTLLPG